MEQNNLIALGKPNSFGFSVLTYDITNNTLVLVELLAKWSKNYITSDKKIDFSVSLSDLTIIDIQNIINENLNFINTKYQNSKYRTYKLETLKYNELVNKFNNRHNNELSTFIMNNESENNFLKIINRFNRKAKIAKLLMDI